MDSRFSSPCCSSQLNAPQACLTCRLYSFQRRAPHALQEDRMDLRFSSLCCPSKPNSLQACKASRLYSFQRRAPHALQELLTPSKEERDPKEDAPTPTHTAMGTRTSGCPCCGRRFALGALAGALSCSRSSFSLASSDTYDSKNLAETIHPARPGWYEELYAKVMDVGMQSYEKQMEGNKARLFNSLGGKALDVLEIGIGTGPNIKYYAKRPDLSIIGVDPNQSMEKYARAAATAAGLEDSQFTFVHAVGEGLPIVSSSVDAVVCTLVLCSVKDVAATLQEVRRVLRPGGSFLFIEHVAAPEGSRLRFWQDVLNPVQELVADGCHLNRRTQDEIQNARFKAVHIESIDVPSVLLFSPQIIGMAEA